jgi:outer membrane protein OmpA-like peptidoglycan-associated protein
MRYICFSILLLLVKPLKAQDGLTGEYYDGSNFEKKIATRMDEKIDFIWHIPPVYGIKTPKYSVRWKGNITAPETGAYDFSVKVNDGSRVWVNNKLIIDCSLLNNKHNPSGYISLEKGKTYPIKIEYFNYDEEGFIALYWALPSKITAHSSNINKIESTFFKQKNQALAIKEEPKSSKPPLRKKTKVNTAESNNSHITADTIEKFTPKNVQFQQSTSVILTTCYTELDNLATFLKRFPKLNLTIEGHTDVIGDPKMNKTLSEERAAAVAKYIIEKGVDEMRILTLGYGSTRPILTDSIKSGHIENRRVSFIIK